LPATDPASERVVVRTATPDDAADVVALLQAGALTQDADDTDLAPYRVALADIGATPGTDVLVAVLDGRVVGTCQLITFRHLQHGGGRCAELESMHVAPEVRGRGVGGVLVESAVDRARDAGCYRVQLTSNLVRTDAHRFYERHGFSPSHVVFKRLLDPGLG
jgi:GNAT superfamily N-acetyltransferase